MTPSRLTRINETLTKWYFVIKSDAETLAEVRRLLLGLLVCLAILYAGSSVLLAPKHKALKQKTAHMKAIRGATPAKVDEILAVRHGELEDQKISLEEKNAILALKERFFSEQWRIWGDAQRFNKIIFTLLPDAPVNMEDKLKQMSRLEKRSHEGFAVYAVNLSGEAAFADLFDYLRYIESQPEVSVIEDLDIERLPQPGYEKPAAVHFSLTVGRMAYEGGEGS